MDKHRFDTAEQSDQVEIFTFFYKNLRISSEIQHGQKEGDFPTFFWSLNTSGTYISEKEKCRLHNMYLRWQNAPKSGAYGKCSGAPNMLLSTKFW